MPLPQLKKKSALLVGAVLAAGASTGLLCSGFGVSPGVGRRPFLSMPPPTTTSTRATVRLEAKKDGKFDDEQRQGRQKKKQQQQREPVQKKKKGSGQFAQGEELKVRARVRRGTQICMYRI